MNIGAIENGSLSHEHYPSRPSKTLRTAMGFSFPAADRVKSAKACSAESHTINALQVAA
jgi:hypothetical protein